MSADQMTRDELIAYHVARRDEAIKQGRALPGWAPEALGRMADSLAAHHAREAAHAARTLQHICGTCRDKAER